MILAYRPFNLVELIGINILSDNQAKNKASIDRCSIFIRVRIENVMQFVDFMHQSAKDCSSKRRQSLSLSYKLSIDHEETATRCIANLTGRLHRNLLAWSDPNATRQKLLARGINH